MWEDTVFFNTCFEYALFSNQQFFDFLFNGDDLRLDLGSLVLGYTSGDDQLANTTGTFKSLLGLDKNVRNILVFTQQNKDSFFSSSRFSTHFLSIFYVKSQKSRNKKGRLYLQPI